ncbi:hypothetical protein L1987_15641 [Smallanthus sonchifolius]|uniref:Uncharacterized protein n=1 Tax=Smallanthus sonchifolius TaxID=185202 RepID=A0ACB9J766_9ASTR|nr:hypothetical protein L1987_15641 [Smallanthus sonchifolius]
MINNRFVVDDLWHYRDPSGNVQGRFSLVQLQKWSTNPNEADPGSVDDLDGDPGTRLDRKELLSRKKNT